MKTYYKKDIIPALFAGVAGVAGSYAIAGFTPEFVVAPISSVVVNNTPSEVIAFSIQVLGDLGHQLGFVFSFFLTLGLFGALAFVGIKLGDLTDSDVLPPVLAGVLSWFIASLLISSPLYGLGVGVPVTVITGAMRWSTKKEEEKESEGIEREESPYFSRRGFVRYLAAVLSFSGVAYLIGNTRGRQKIPLPTPGSTGDGNTQNDVQTLLDRADERSLDIEGIPGL
ncbi:MAG: hypothetical protein SV377_01340, partial [Halobacteria archaeon]|nr:hypothetical protein [Halobacteria archaeon]